MDADAVKDKNETAEAAESKDNTNNTDDQWFGCCYESEIEDFLE